MMTFLPYRYGLIGRSHRGTPLRHVESSKSIRSPTEPGWLRQVNRDVPYAKRSWVATVATRAGLAPVDGDRVEIVGAVQGG
jgi:cephalosporin-C deacetylase-like acetyl esterase